jgi:hypothetical protein
MCVCVLFLVFFFSIWKYAGGDCGGDGFRTFGFNARIALFAFL